MDFDLSDDQVALQDGARELLDALASSDRRSARTQPADAAYDPALWSAMADQGWLGIEVAGGAAGSASGGRGGGALRGAGPPCRARRPSCRPCSRSTRSTGAGDDEWVERLVAGDALACVAWDPAAPVPYAPSADVAVVLAR